MMTTNQNVKTGTPTNLVEQVARHAAQSMVRWFEQKTGLVFSLNVRVDFSPKRSASRGGIRREEAFITLAVASVTEAIRNNKPHTHLEYAHYRNSPTIGQFTGSWDKCLLADIAHEITHAVVWYFNDSPNVRRAFGITAALETNHGEYFQQLYRAFREQFVNNRVFNETYIVLHEEPKINKRAPKPLAAKRPVNGVKMILSKGNSGWFVHKYYNADDKLIGTMASKPNYSSQGLVDGKWETVIDPKTRHPFSNHNAAKKHFLKL